ncbi:PepSY domain-containing protein [Antarctobacter heliothermus]|uniref:Peptidase propeptide and YPEB domain-containing protein n=1 Tax=Antarctobacter heliothermus TaxID=74033 RepID=A0A239H3A9_9RHOB|nr:PepSY domain-containing protein [Antarctobacter heliothermus]SNS74744.1 Peptidase propeptide and YPEB domain-containing protein [Antarctobacter heliothermus]
MTRTLAVAFAVVIAAPSFAGSHEIPQDTVDKITAMLAEMKCQMDPDDIKTEDGGYELDDVICEGGHQFDIELDADLNEVGRRAE